jgi:hypothetical protein
MTQLVKVERDFWKCTDCGKTFMPTADREAPKHRCPATKADAVEKFLKGAKKMRVSLDGIQHHLWCNFWMPGCEYCNCGIADVIQALKEYEEAIE